jgi:hypothetical protein
MKQFLSVIVILILHAACAAQSKIAVTSTHANLAPALDTDPHAKFWQDAKPIYAEVDPQGKLLPEYRTVIRSRWTSTDIYFLFVCPYKQLSVKALPKTEQETYELWNWNVAEVFLGSDFSDIKRYKEFEISPQNEWVDLDVNLHNPHHEQGWTWNSGFEHRARIDEKTHTWYAAMRIPFAAIDSRPVQRGTEFRANFYRTDGSGADEKAVMWQAVLNATFHVPERFGLLKLE